MKIEDYFQQIREASDNCPVAQSLGVNYDKRGTYVGFIRGEIYFVDGTTLHLREFVNLQRAFRRLAYSYQYMTANHQLIFRYDDTAHHKKLHLPTHPHHKHDGSEDNVVASAAPDLTAVLGEIEALVQAPN